MLTSLTFDLTVSNNAALNDFVLAYIQVLSGWLTFSNNAALSSLQLSKLQTVSGSLKVEDQPSSLSLALPLLSVISGSVDVCRNQNLISFTTVHSALSVGTSGSSTTLGPSPYRA